MVSKLAHRRQNFQSLDNTLQPGNKTDAQKAFAQQQNDGLKIGQTQNSKTLQNWQDSPLQTLTTTSQKCYLSGSQNDLRSLNDHESPSPSAKGRVF
jgi:hypothetical protein